MPRPRTQAQKEAEKRAEAESYGKTLVRHTEQSAAALIALRERFPEMSDPALARLAIEELAGVGNAPVNSGVTEAKTPRRARKTR